VTPAVFQKLAFGQRQEGLLAVAVASPKPLTEVKIGDRPLIAVLEGVEKPGNLGAVIRAADGAGIDALILADGVTDLYNPNTIRASLGTVFTLPIAVERSEAVLAWLREREITVMAARVDGAVDYDRADFTPPTAIVLGSEARGLSPAWSGDDVTAIRLPMRGAADSLNLSTTAAVLFYEAQRQRCAK
jgi:TrmH family RNA methyltransferase